MGVLICLCDIRHFGEIIVQFNYAPIATDASDVTIVYSIISQTEAVGGKMDVPLYTFNGEHDLVVLAGMADLNRREDFCSDIFLHFD